MWSPFRRASRGRHALGAAVTALPTGPAATPAPAATALEPPPSLVPPESAPRQAGSALPGIIDELLALAAELDAVAFGADSSAPLTQRPGPVQERVREAGPDAPAPAPGGPRVELGFTDGTYRTLDPASASARALGDLVGELTRGAPHPGARGSGRA